MGAKRGRDAGGGTKRPSDFSSSPTDAVRFPSPRLLATSAASVSWWFVRWPAASRPTNMLVYHKDGSAQAILCAATLRRKLQIKLSTSPSHSILTPGRPVLALTPGAWQGSHWSANFEATGMTRPGKILSQTGFKPWPDLWLTIFLSFLAFMKRTSARCFPGSLVCLLVGCLTSCKHSSVSQGRICSDKFTCCHTEKEVADQTFYLTQSQYTDTGPTSPCADPTMPGAWQGSHWSASF